MDFKISHPVEGGDRCTVFEFADESALAAMRGAIRVNAQSMLARAAACHSVDALAVEEYALACAGALHAYRTLLRLQRGLERAYGGDSLARVAVDCGFSHHSHFTAAFRKYFGTIPSQLRKISTAS